MQRVKLIHRNKDFGFLFDKSFFYVKFMRISYKHVHQVDSASFKSEVGVSITLKLKNISHFYRNTSSVSHQIKVRA